MKQNIIFLILFCISSFPLLAQNESEKIDDDWDKFQECLEANIIDPVIDKVAILEKLNKKFLESEDDYLLIIEDNYRNAIRNIIEDSIKQASLELPKLKEQYSNDVEISIELSNKFIFYFTNKYSKHYNLEKCARSKNDLPVFDYMKFFNTTYNIINQYKCNLNNRNSPSPNFQNKEEYLTFALLFKMAILKYKPSLSNYVTKDVLQGWEKVFLEHRTINQL